MNLEVGHVVECPTQLESEEANANNDLSYSENLITSCEGWPKTPLAVYRDTRSLGSRFYEHW